MSLYENSPFVKSVVFLYFWFLILSEMFFSFKKVNFKVLCLRVTRSGIQVCNQKLTIVQLLQGVSCYNSLTIFHSQPHIFRSLLNPFYLLTPDIIYHCHWLFLMYKFFKSNISSIIIKINLYYFYYNQFSLLSSI